MFSARKSGSPAGGYNIANSLRFQSASSTSLNRTFSSGGDQQKLTWSFWVKRGTLGSSQTLLVVGVGSSYESTIKFNSTNTLEVLDYTVGGGYRLQLITTQVFRDPSAWYHIVVAIDTTQATASNRVKIYINGLQVTAFGTATYPSQNLNTNFNIANTYYIGRYYASSTDLLDGYLTEYNFIGGQALTPSDFGETNATTGQWIAKKYNGTYGTNGFYLPFSNGTSTTTLGADSSGNGNNWTLNNFTRSAGVSDCWMYDVPSGNGSSVGGTQPNSNYAVLNPLDKGALTIDSANLHYTRTSSTADWEHSRATIQMPSAGKWYFEMVYNGGSTDGITFGLCPSTFSLSSDFAGGTYTNVYAWTTLAFLLTNNSVVSYGSSPTTGGDTLMCAYDADNDKIYFGKNGTWFNSSDPVAQTNPAATSVPKNLFPFYGARSTGNGSANFGQRSFAYTPPSGFKALCTANLPASTIVKGNEYMDATLWTGNGTSQTITNSGSMQPDLIWTKSRSVNGYYHVLIDSVRGITKALYSNATDAENTLATRITAINSNGFTIGSSGDMNDNAQTFVGWQWQAGQGATSSNTNGSITSTVSVNATAGFSIVTYTGTGANATVGHGLGVAPKMIIIKRRNGVVNWPVFNINIGNQFFLQLNTADNATNQSIIPGGNWWNNTNPTSSVFSIGTVADNNASGGTFVAYAFAEIAGFSRFGSYTGNGNADGPFVYTGFRPKYVLFKRTDAASYWEVYDSVRNPYNLTNSALNPNLSNAEYTGGSTNQPLDLLSNGFKLRGSGGDGNANGGTYIYMAFAESPFSSSNAR